jgi:hypothetical protein
MLYVRETSVLMKMLHDRSANWLSNQWKSEELSWPSLLDIDQWLVGVVPWHTTSDPLYLKKPKLIPLRSSLLLSWMPIDKYGGPNLSCQSNLISNAIMGTGICWRPFRLDWFFFPCSLTTDTGASSWPALRFVPAKVPGWSAQPSRRIVWDNLAERLLEQSKDIHSSLLTGVVAIQYHRRLCLIERTDPNKDLNQGSLRFTNLSTRFTYSWNLFKL